MACEEQPLIVDSPPESRCSHRDMYADFLTYLRTRRQPHRRPFWVQAFGWRREGATRLLRALASTLTVGMFVAMVAIRLNVLRSPLSSTGELPAPAQLRVAC